MSLWRWVIQRFPVLRGWNGVQQEIAGFHQEIALLRRELVEARRDAGAVRLGLDSLDSVVRDGLQTVSDDLRQAQVRFQEMLQHALDEPHAQTSLAQQGHDQLLRAVEETRQWLAEVQTEAGRRLDEIQREQEALLAALTCPPFMTDKNRYTQEGGLGYDRGGAAPVLTDFASAFRGTEGHVADRMEPYLKHIAAGPVLDIGSGRGELLRLLASGGIPAWGIDADAQMVSHCQNLGLDVRHGDAADVMGDLGDATIGAVTAIHVLEHLDAKALGELLAQVRRVLRPGGCLVAETVNPYSVGAARLFWADPTHVTMLYPEVFLWLLEQAGFRRAHVFHPQGAGDFSQDRTRCSEFAVVAWT